jgi:hypothetical protein
MDTETPFELHVVGRESAQAERCKFLAVAEHRAQEISESLGREVRVYDVRLGPLASPVYRVSLTKRTDDLSGEES